MSVEELREQLDRLAEGAPEVSVPADTWSRARRARRRDLGLGVLAGAAAVALVVGLVSWLPDRGDVDPAGTGGVGVPETIHAVPSGALEPVSDLAVGRSAAVLMSEDDLPVVVDADDGSYTALSLPGFGALQAEQGAVSLSPDGRRLAWAWSESEGGRTRTGVRIADLQSGDVRTVRSRTPIFVYTFAWSADGRWLVWDGTDARWGSNGFTAGDAAAGRVGPGSDVITPLPRTNEESTRLAVADDGDVLIATARKERRWTPAGAGEKERPGGWYPALVDAASGVRMESVDRNGADNTLVSVYRGVWQERTVPAPSLRGTRVEQLGWVHGRAVALVSDPGSPASPSQLALIQPGATVDIRTVGEVRGATHVSVAVGLMDPDHPTVDRPAPSWLDDDAGSWTLVLTGAAGALVLLAALGWWLARRRTSPRP